MIVTVIGYNGNNDFVAVINVADFDNEDIIKSTLIAEATIRGQADWGTAEDIRIDVVIAGAPEILIDNTMDGWANLV